MATWHSRRIRIAVFHKTRGGGAFGVISPSLSPPISSLLSPSFPPFHLCFLLLLLSCSLPSLFCTLMLLLFFLSFFILLSSFPLLLILLSLLLDLPHPYLEKTSPIQPFYFHNPIFSPAPPPQKKKIFPLPLPPSFPPPPLILLPSVSHLILIPLSSSYPASLSGSRRERIKSIHETRFSPALVICFIFAPVLCRCSFPFGRWKTLERMKDISFFLSFFRPRGGGGRERREEKFWKCGLRSGGWRGEKRN